MKDLAQKGFSSDQVKAALLSSRTLNFRYDRYSKNNIYIGVLDGVLSASVDHAAFADIKRTAKFTIKDDASIDWLNDRIKPYMLLKMSTGAWLEWPLGMFMLSSPALTAANTIRQTRAIDAYDQTFILTSDKTTTRFTVNAGSVVTTEILGLLSGAGIAMRNIVPSPLTMATARDWDPGTPKIVIINALLNAINYQALWFDSDGYAQGIPYRSPAEVGSGETYYDDSKSVLAPEATKNLDLFQVPNKWVAVVSDPERASLRSEYTNTQAASPTSTVSRGFTSVDYREANDVPDQATLDAYVARLAYEASQVYEHTDINTALMPHHEHMDVLDVRYTRLGVQDRYQEVGWSMDLRVGARMKHNLRKLVVV